MTKMPNGKLPIVAEFLVLFLSLTALFASPAPAQTPTKEIQSLSVSVEPIDSDAKACGLMESSLRTSAEYLLEGAGLPVSESPTNPLINISSTVISEGHKDGSLFRCTAYVEVQLLGSVFSQVWGGGTIVYFSTGRLLYASNKEFDAYVKGHVEEMLKKIIVDIKKAQH